MKKLLMLLLTTIALISFQKEEYVLICDSKNAHAYHKDYKSHNEYCGGLKSCKHEIKRITKSEAERLGKLACKKCW